MAIAFFLPPEDVRWSSDIGGTVCFP